MSARAERDASLQDGEKNATSDAKVGRQEQWDPMAVVVSRADSKALTLSANSSG